MAKMHLVPIRRGYWGKNSGLPHTVKKNGVQNEGRVPGACAGGVVLTIFHTDSDEALRDLW